MGGEFALGYHQGVLRQRPLGQFGAVVQPVGHGTLGQFPTATETWRLGIQRMGMTMFDWLSGRKREQEPVEPERVAPVGVKASGSQMPPIDVERLESQLDALRNTTIPVTKAEVFSTLFPDQDKVHLKIYQGVVTHCFTTPSHFVMRIVAFGWYNTHE
jgi:hypothetical protein